MTFRKMLLLFVTPVMASRAPSLHDSGGKWLAIQTIVTREERVVYPQEGRIHALTKAVWGQSRGAKRRANRAILTLFVPGDRRCDASRAHVNHAVGNFCCLVAVVRHMEHRESQLPTYSGKLSAQHGSEIRIEV